jgi:hypothetical protein
MVYVHMSIHIYCTGRSGISDSRQLNRTPALQSVRNPSSLARAGSMTPHGISSTSFNGSAHPRAGPRLYSGGVYGSADSLEEGSQRRPARPALLQVVPATVYTSPVYFPSQEDRSGSATLPGPDPDPPPLEKYLSTLYE